MQISLHYRCYNAKAIEWFGSCCIEKDILDKIDLDIVLNDYFLWNIKASLCIIVNGVIVICCLFEVIKQARNTCYFAISFIVSIVSAIIYRYLRVRMSAKILSFYYKFCKKREAYVQLGGLFFEKYRTVPASEISYNPWEDDIK
jgi:hypothetical protein